VTQAKATSNNHRETKVTAPVLDSTRDYTKLTLVLSEILISIEAG